MDKLSVIGKIGTILSDLKKQQEYFSTNPQSINEVEVELFAASATYLAEYAKVLKKFPASKVASRTIPSDIATKAARRADDDDIGFRLNIEDEELVPDNKKIHQAAGRDESTAPAAKSPLKPAVEPTESPAAGERPVSPSTAPMQQPSDQSSTPAADRRPDPSPDRQPDPAPDIAANPDRSGKAPELPVTPERSEKAASPDPVAPIGDVPAHRDAAAPSMDEKLTPSGPASALNEGPQPPATPVTPASAGSQQDAPSGSPQQDAPSGPPRRESLNERFSEKKTTLYERIAPQQAGQQASSGTPIANLGRSIGINERYYFIKTLFQDDKVAFDQAITRIDICHSLGEALEYVNKSLAGKYSWSRKEEDARKFYDLLKRRFV